MFSFVSQIIGRGTICRESKDPCDFTEYCNGISEFCVPDTKAFDLEPCNNKTAFCYEGTCRDPDVQCLELFGKCNSCIFFLGFIFKLYFSKVSNPPCSHNKKSCLCKFKFENKIANESNFELCEEVK